MDTRAYRGKGQGKGKGSREGRIGQGGQEQYTIASCQPPRPWCIVVKALLFVACWQFFCCALPKVRDSGTVCCCTGWGCSAHSVSIGDEACVLLCGVVVCVRVQTAVHAFAQLFYLVGTEHMLSDHLPWAYEKGLMAVAVAQSSAPTSKRCCDG